MTVQNFISAYGPATIVRDFPGEWFERSRSGAGRRPDIRKLLRDNRFTK